MNVNVTLYHHTSDLQRDLDEVRRVGTLGGTWGGGSFIFKFVFMRPFYLKPQLPSIYVQMKSGLKFDKSSGRDVAL